jgi:hypothetical protein
MIKTKFFDDFIEYYKKAYLLQERNKLIPDSFYGKLTSDIKLQCGDPIMDNVTIYDTVNRKFAGFSKALEDIHGVRVRKDLIKYQDFTNRLTSHQFHFLHLFHRFTGSGSSFQPTYLPDGTRNPREHGYYNNHVEELAKAIESGGIDLARRYIVECDKPMVTSVGNQPPSLKNGDPSKYRLAMQYYFDNYAEKFIDAYMTFLMNYEYEHNKPAGIKDGVDFSCQWHKDQGFKQWHFVLTAFVMDTAEYYPELVDPNSHCYYGANCIRGFDLMFIKEKSDPKKRDQWYEACMTELCKAVNGRPYDVEDVVCDIIRYWSEYIPKGYDHLTEEQTKNNSTLKVNGAYPLDVQQRIKEIIG